MEKETSLSQVKIGAGKSTLIYAFIVFIVSFTVWAFTIVFFPVYFNVSAFSNESFKMMSFVSAFFVIILIPCILFLFGYHNKKLQIEYLKGLIEDEKYKIRCCNNSIERNNKETQERITQAIIEHNLSYETTNLTNQDLILQIKNFHNKVNNETRNKNLEDIEKHEKITIELKETLKLFK